MKLAVWQMQAVAGDVAANIESIRLRASEAADKGAQILVCPELALPGYGAAAAMSDLAATVEDAQILALQKIADQYTIALIVGFAERTPDCLFNSAVCIQPHQPSKIYRKSHLYGPYEKSHFTAAKPENCLLEIAGLTLGLLICYDVEFPENVRRLAVAGADLVIVPTALPSSDHADFIARKLVPVRAFENQVFVAYANHSGSDTEFSYFGHSGIFAPSGEALAVAGADEALLICDIKPDDYIQSKAENSYLVDL